MDKAAKGRLSALAAAAAMLLMAAVVPAVVMDAGRGIRRVDGAAPAPAAPAPSSAASAAAAATAPAPGSDPTPLARRAVQRGLLELATQSDIWNLVESGDPPAGLRLDAVYRDAELPGVYSVGLSSGPLFGQVTVTGVARVGGEVRSLRAIYDYFPRPPLREVSCSWDAGQPRCP